MLRLVLGLTALLAVLVLLEQRLERRAYEGARGAAAIELLIDPAQKSGVRVAAVEFSRAGRGDALLYVRAKGLWRCAQAFGAVADAREIEALIASFTHARGLERTSDPTRAEQYGFESGRDLVVSFHGPRVLEAEDRDLLFSYDLGRAFDAGPHGTSFVRASGTQRILEIDRNPRTRVEPRDARALPPMIDPRLMAGTTPAGFKGFREFFIDLEAGETLHLRSDSARVADPAPEAHVVWMLDDERKRVPCPPWRIAGYSTMWFRAECRSIGDPRRAADLGLDPPFARVTLVRIEDDPIEFHLSRVNAKNEMLVWNRTTNVVYVVGGEMQSLLAPDAGMFLDETRDNPWERWLSK